MKKNRFIVPLVLVALLSCSKDDDGLANKIVIENEAIVLTNGYYFDIEDTTTSSSGRLLHGTHYAQTFILTDGSIETKGTNLICVDCTFKMTIEAYSAGADAFNSEDFNSEDRNILPLSSTAAGSYLFISAEFIDGSARYTSTQGGTVSIDVNEPTFTFKFDLPANDISDLARVDEELTVEISGRFKGEFQEMDASLLETEH